MTDDGIFFIAIAVAFIIGVIAGRVSKSVDDYGPPEGAAPRLYPPIRDVSSPGCKVVSMPTVKPSHAWPGKVAAQRVQTQVESKVERGDAA